MKSQGLLSIFILSAGNVVGTMVSAIALILFSRFMGPSEFGIFSAAFAAMQLAVRFADLGLNTAIERSVARVNGKDPRMADRYMRIGVWIKGVTTVVMMSVGWFISPWLAHTILHIDTVNIIRIALLLSAGTIFFEFTTVLLQSRQHFLRVAQITIAQAIGKLIFGVILIWQKSLTAMTGLLVYALMPLVGAIPAWVKSPVTSFAAPTAWRKELATIISVAKWMAISAISASLADNIDVLLVQSFMKSYDTGLWSAVVRIAAFASVFGWSISSALSNRVASYHDKKHLDAYLAKSWKLALASLVLILCAIPFSRLAIWLTVGTSYLSADFVLQILLVATAISTATTPFIALFYLFDKPRYYAYSGILQTIILIGGDYFAIPAFGLAGAAWVRVMVRVIMLLFTLVYVRRAYQEKYA